ncbi:uncharacterized protein EHS24_004726 [Apiotrichum porosum]|uniref:Ricin B lectin domain-containing protein n=1 Tax=Apiotrichum porosum TaxID=105984 RepID=A0A427Y5W9_9TREE|nr:uncharacterized protein EHS24_004726 [Apiotrichum porosum]RSH86470.1 hypothetical protein EHS24_004726 [Apiotrichum porosum]
MASQFQEPRHTIQQQDHIMQLSTLALLFATVGFATAAPAPRDYCPRSQDVKTGAYIDTGCGTTLHPHGKWDLCVRTKWDIAAGNDFFLGECVAGYSGGSGGRYRLNRGRTQIQSKESSSDAFCITAPISESDGDWAKVHSCRGLPSQTWIVTDNMSINLADTNKCLEVSHFPGARLRVAECNGSDDQIFDILGGEGVPAFTPSG